MNFKIAERLVLNFSNLYFQKVDLAHASGTAGETQRQQDPRELLRGSRTAVGAAQGGLVASETMGARGLLGRDKPSHFAPRRTASRLPINELL